MAAKQHFEVSNRLVWFILALVILTNRPEAAPADPLHSIRGGLGSFGAAAGAGCDDCLTSRGVAQPMSDRHRRGSLQTRLNQLLQQTATKQDNGADVSPIVPFLQHASWAIETGDDALAMRLIDEAEDILAGLVLQPPCTEFLATVTVSADILGVPIPHLAGNIVVQDFYDDPRLERFMDEIGPGLVQIKLFLADLERDHGNYVYKREPGVWQDWIQQIHAQGGEVLLHFRNVPSRLTADPEANCGDPFTGKAPMTDEGESEWTSIVRETIEHFNLNGQPGANIDFVQDIGEPNIGTNWYDPLNRCDPRPENVVAFARHFENTVQAVHAADPAVLVGGPTLWFSSNDATWWDQCLGYLSDNQVDMGLATVHIYDVNFGIWDHGMSLAREKLDQYGFDSVPLMMTEWNTNIGTLALPPAIGKSHLGASHATMGLIKALHTDNFRQTHFYLGPGRDAIALNPGVEANATHALLLLRDGQALPNTNYNAFCLFSMLHGMSELQMITANSQCIFGTAGSKGEEVSVLLTNYEPLLRDFETPGFPYEEPDWDRSSTVKLRIPGLPEERYRVEIYRVDQENANIHTLGEIGAELDVPEMSAALGLDFELELQIPIYGVQLIRLTPTQSPSLSTFVGCLAGPNMMTPSGTCSPINSIDADWDVDGDVDLRDYALLEIAR